MRIGTTDGTGLECGVLSPRSIIMSRAWFRAHQICVDLNNIII